MQGKQHVEADISHTTFSNAFLEWTCLKYLKVDSNLQVDMEWERDSLLQWRHNGHDGVSNHQPHDYLLNCLFRR